jgi:hypothetical protein
MRASEPVVVVMAEGTGLEAFADVLIAVADRQSPAVHCAVLHARYPGLSLALVVCGDRLVAGFWDGTSLTVAGTSREAIAVARRLYRSWVLSRRPAQSAGDASDRRGPSPTR